MYIQYVCIYLFIIHACIDIQNKYRNFSQIFLVLSDFFSFSFAFSLHMHTHSPSLPVMSCSFRLSLSHIFNFYHSTPSIYYTSLPGVPSRSRLLFHKFCGILFLDTASVAAATDTTAFIVIVCCYCYCHILHI